MNQPLELIPTGMGDTLLGFVATHNANLSIGRTDDDTEREPEGDWMVAIEWGREAPDSPMVGAAAYGVGEALHMAIGQALSEAGVNPCARCGYAATCPDEECHS